MKRQSLLASLAAAAILVLAASRYLSPKDNSLTTVGVGLFECPEVRIDSIGRVIAAVGDDRRIHFLRLDGTEFARSDCETAYELTLGPGGRIAIAAERRGTQVRWVDSTTGKSKPITSISGVDVGHFVLSASGHFLYVETSWVKGGDEKDELMKLDARTGQVLLRVVTQHFPNSPGSLAISPTDRYVAVGGYGRVMVYDSGSFKKVRDVMLSRAGPMADDVTTCSFSQDGNELLVGSEGNLRLVSIAQPEMSADLSGPIVGRGIAATGWNSRLATFQLVTMGGNIFLLSKEGKFVYGGRIHRYGVSSGAELDSAAWTADGKVLVAGYEGGRVEIVRDLHYN